MKRASCRVKKIYFVFLQRLNSCVQWNIFVNFWPYLNQWVSLNLCLWIVEARGSLGICSKVFWPYLWSFFNIVKMKPKWSKYRKTGSEDEFGSVQKLSVLSMSYSDSYFSNIHLLWNQFSHTTQFLRFLENFTISNVNENFQFWKFPTLNISIFLSITIT